MPPGLAKRPRHRRRRATFGAAAIASLLVLASCAGSGSGAEPRNPGTVLEAASRCDGVPADEQRDEPIQVLHAFEGDDGANPWGGLEAWEGVLYGRTAAGGEHDSGVVFGIQADGSDYELVKSFTAGPDNGEGNHPRHDHVNPVNGLLYSNTFLGGTGDGGVVFSLDPDTGEERIVHEFAGAPTDGAKPHSGFLVTSRGMWILTAEGGEHDLGALVKVDPQTGATEVAHSFAGPDGATPLGRVVRHGEKTIYGMTSRGGSNDAGVIFTMDPDTYEYQVVHEFGPGPDNGSRPANGALRQGYDTDRRLWGVTAEGGAHGQGTLFTIEADGSGFQVQHSFGASADDAARPQGSLIWAQGHYYGTSFEGGRFGLGSVYRIAAGGVGYEVVASFGGSETGAFPRDELLPHWILDDPAAIYGMTGNGGSNDPDCQQALGVIFRIDLADLGG